LKLLENGNAYKVNQCNCKNKKNRICDCYKYLNILIYKNVYNLKNCFLFSINDFLITSYIYIYMLFFNTYKKGVTNQYCVTIFKIKIINKHKKFADKT